MQYIFDTTISKKIYNSRIIYFKRILISYFKKLLQTNKVQNIFYSQQREKPV